MQLLEVIELEDAQRLVETKLDKIISTEIIDINSCIGRTISKDIYAKCNIPTWDKSTVDGYAVYSKDTVGSSDSVATFLDIKNSVQMGSSLDLTLERGQASYVPTGGVLPNGSDSVVMMEYADDLGNVVALIKSVSVGENVMKVAEDIEENSILFKRGEIIGAGTIGTLASQGIDKIEVYKKLKVTILSTGDELVDIYKEPLKGQIRDINTYTISALCSKNNLEINSRKIIRDNKKDFIDAIQEATQNSDLVIFSGGSSKGDKDYTIDALSSVGEVLFHGIAIQPGKPTLSSFDRENETLVVGLPGHPMAAMIIFYKLIIETLEKIQNIKGNLTIEREVSTNIPGSPGRKKIVPIRLIDDNKCEALFGKSAAILSISKADGYLEISKNSEGINKGDICKINLFKGGRL